MSGRVVPLRRSPGGLDDLDDVALLAACARGDRAAVAVLFRRFTDDVVGFLARMLGHGQSDVDDVVQLTFLAAVQGATRFAGQSSVRTWLLGIAAHQAHNHLRSRRRSREVAARLAELPVAPSEDPERGAERRERSRQLQEAMDRLSPEHRAAFLLCEVEGVPGAEAAVLLGVNLGTLWRRLSEARARLRVILKKEKP